MKNKIDEIIKLPKEYIDNLGSKSRQHVIEKFSIEKMLEGYLNFYQNTVL